MSGPSYNQNDLLLLLGQCTVELAYLRARVAELESLARAMDEQARSNGTIDVAEVPA